MFDIGFSELVLIGVLALVIAGPERLPGIMRTLGRMAGRARAMIQSLQTELEREMESSDAGQEQRENRADKSDV